MRLAQLDKEDEKQKRRDERIEKARRIQFVGGRGSMEAWHEEQDKKKGSPVTLDEHVPDSDSEGVRFFLIWSISRTSIIRGSRTLKKEEIKAFAERELIMDYSSFDEFGLQIPGFSYNFDTMVALFHTSTPLNMDCSRK
uniref:DUF3395 domain-containing protein n=1 Tax=Caenorhabditis tropicalis TaxID=1561998 RepID=A0A1I7TPI2_9PELO